MTSAIFRSTLSLCMLLALTGCNAIMRDVGVEPAMTAPNLNVGMVDTMQSPNLFPAQPISTNASWPVRSTGLFLNKRALSAGDILTVQIAMNDKAQLTNKSNRNRTGSKSLGVEGSFDVAGAGSAANLDASLRNATDFTGNGGTSRSENINLSVAAIVTGVLPNGNLVISGSQEVRVNAELRILTITGIVRPTDILPNNTISYERIAEARVSYGGRGRITEVQQPAYGHQFLDRISPL